MNIVLDLTGVSDVVTMLRGVGDRMIDETPAMQAIETVMLRSAQLNFVEQGRPTPWAPLKEATVKRRRGATHEILRDTGLLMQSLSTGGNEYAMREITQQSAQVGTNRPGASAHQDGLGYMPMRQFLVHQLQDIEDYKVIITDFIVHGLGSGGVPVPGGAPSGGVAGVAPTPKKPRGPKKAKGPTTAGGHTWASFTKANMGAYMKSEGGHGPAMARLGKEWAALKAKK